MTQMPQRNARRTHRVQVRRLPALLFALAAAVVLLSIFVPRHPAVWWLSWVAPLDPLDTDRTLAFLSVVSFAAIALGLLRGKRVSWWFAVATFAAALFVQASVLDRPIGLVVLGGGLAVLVADRHRYRLPRRRSRASLTLAALAILAVLASAGCWVPTAAGPPASSGRPSAVARMSVSPGASAARGPAVQPPDPGLPAPAVVLRNLRTRPWAFTPTLESLLRLQRGDPSFALDPKAGFASWRLAHPDPRVVAGYPGRASVAPGERLDLHLRSTGGPVRLDIFRIGRDDARRMMVVGPVKAGPQPLAKPDPATGLVAEHWPVSTTIAIPADWPSGVYLAKLTARSGAQAYLPFIVRATTAQPLMVMLPTMTEQAYNPYGGPDLYGWPGGPRSRAYAVSYDRPLARGYGSGTFFRLDFPLIVWLEDHGYQPAYVADVDVARDPSLVTGARTVIVSGHSEYWTGSLHDAFDAALAAGVNLAAFAANDAWWQVRLAPNAAGTPARTVIAYKDAALDPLRATDPEGVSARFSQLPHPRLARDLFGEDYGGMVGGLKPMRLGPDIARFAPASGLLPGQLLPGLIGGEVDRASTQPGALSLAFTPTRTSRRRALHIGASAWVAPSGARVFDAGTFDWAWGLDRRYAAGLSGFPADAFGVLTASILGWLGAFPAP